VKKAASFEGCLNTLLGNDFRDDGFSYWTGFLSDWISWFLSDLDQLVSFGFGFSTLRWFFFGLDDMVFFRIYYLTAYII